jgi:hypothetical protein
MKKLIKVTINENNQPVIKGTPQVPFKLSAKLSKEDGSQTIYFIDKNFGISQGLMSKMDFKVIHPTRPNLCEITIPIERIDG